MENVLTTIFATMMLAIFCAMFGYELRVLQECKERERRKMRVKKDPEIKSFAKAQNCREPHRVYEGEIYSEKNACDIVSVPIEKTVSDGAMCMRFAEIQRAYQDGECVATKEVYGCRKKEADADDQ